MEAYSLRISSVLLTLVCWTASTAVASKLTCQQGNGFWSLVNSKGAVIGASDVGFSEEIGCQKAAKGQHLNVVCSWNGQSYQPYNIENGKALGIEAKTQHYDALQDCQALVQAHTKPSPFFCAWNGGHFIPFNRADNTLLSSSTSGWERDFAACIKDAVNTATDNLICGWDNGPALYAKDGLRIAAHFKTKEDCQGLTKSLRIAGAARLEFALISKSKGKTQESIQPFKDGKPDEKVGFSPECQVREASFHHTKSKDGYLLSPCAPDTLYSWGGFDKLESLLRVLRDGAPWPEYFSRSVFTTPSAAGTFGYGTLPLRFKIKPGVKFKLLVSPNGYTCEDFITTGLVSKSELLGTIPVRLVNSSNGRSFIEYTLCSPQVIESWSFATQEHYDEILRDHTWMTTKHYHQWEAYSKTNGVDDYLDNTIDSTAVYQTNFSIETFKRQMGLLRTMTQSGFGKVNLPLGAVTGSRENHFTTQRPNYFNPN